MWRAAGLRGQRPYREVKDSLQQLARHCQRPCCINSINTSRCAADTCRHGGQRLETLCCSVTKLGTSSRSRRDLLQRRHRRQTFSVVDGVQGILRAAGLLQHVRTTARCKNLSKLLARTVWMIRHPSCRCWVLPLLFWICGADDVCRMRLAAGCPPSSARGVRASRSFG